MTAPDINFDGLIEAAGIDLATHLAEGTYEPGHEERLTRDLVAALDRAGAVELLVWLLNDLFSEQITIDCLLDETDERSYALTGALAGRMYDEISYQGRTDIALYELTVRAIDRRSRLIQRHPEAVQGIAIVKAEG